LTTPTGHRYTTVPPARGPITHEPTNGPITQEARGTSLGSNDDVSSSFQAKSQDPRICAVSADVAEPSTNRTGVTCQDLGGHSPINPAVASRRAPADDPPPF
jgi:hypothetical protein